MKKFFLNTLLTSVFLAGAFLIPHSTTQAVHVSGYFRSNGTYVQPYERTAPDSNPYNNYSFPGNYNPNTGNITGGNPQTYLNNYYDNSSGNSYYPTTNISTYTPTPTCPLNSYYDGISSCKCDYGYSASGGTCVLNDTLCHQQIGYFSSYDSLSGNCKCDTGYSLNSSRQCAYNSTSFFNSYIPTETNDQICSDSYGINNHWDGTKTADGLLNCNCKTGYVWNSNRTACVVPAVNTGMSASVISSQTNSSSCAQYGSGSEQHGSLCYCSHNYIWNADFTSCEIGNPVFTKYLQLGSSGSQVVNLKNLLAVEGIYLGKVNTDFDTDTKDAVKNFQEVLGVPQTGTVGPKTRAAINKYIGNNFQIQ